MPGQLLPINAPRLREKIPAQGGLMGGRLRILPWWDGHGHEPPEFRRACRQMIHESNIKAALLDKVFSVASLDLQVHAADDDPRDELIAEGTRVCLEGMDGGLRGFFEQCVLNGLIDNHSVCEKVWRTEERGKWRGQEVLQVVKFKDGVDLIADPFNNVMGVRGWGDDGGMRDWPVEDFVVFVHLPLFGRLTGTSDFRAAYKGWWLIETVDELRAHAAEKFSTPFLLGEYPPNDDVAKAAIERSMEAAAGQTWASIPTGMKITVVDLATRGAADYQAFKADMRQDIFVGICGAMLQAVEGTVASGRGNSQVHRSTADTRAWYLSSVASQLIGQQLVPQYVDRNYLGNPAYPTVTLDSIDDGEMASSLLIDQGLQGMGWQPSIKELGKKYGRTFAREPGDILKRPVAAPAQAPGADPFALAPGAGG